MLIQFSICGKLKFTINLTYLVDYRLTQILDVNAICFIEWHSSQGSTMNRRTALTIRVVIVTSLVWFLLDVFLLMYFTDCTSSKISGSDGCATAGTGLPVGAYVTGKLAMGSTGPVRGFFDRLIPDGKLCIPAALDHFMFCLVNLQYLF
jgi:hypothetical protein